MPWILETNRKKAVNTYTYLYLSSMIAIFSMHRLVLKEGI